MRRFCDLCEREVDAQVVKKPEVFPVKGEPIQVLSEVLQCPNCGEAIFDERLDDQTLNRAFDAYRAKHKLLSAQDIRTLREHYGSGRTVATLLGWSQATMVRYENGAIPDSAHHDQLLRLRQDPDYFKFLLAQRGSKLKARELARLNLLLSTQGTENPDVDPVAALASAFRKFYDLGFSISDFDFEKLAAMVQMFALSNRDLVKTKLQKLLFYSDFLCVKRYGHSITGMVYLHNHYGPVPAHHDLVHWALQTANVIDTKPFEGLYEGEVIIATEEPDLSFFCEEERDVIQTVADYFHDYSATKISEFSHREPGFRKTRLKEIIPFDFAPELSLV